MIDDFPVLGTFTGHGGETTHTGDNDDPFDNVDAPVDTPDTYTPEEQEASPEEVLECALVTQAPFTYICTRAQTTIDYYTDLCLQRYATDANAVENVRDQYIALECQDNIDITGGAISDGVDVTDDVDRTATLVGPYVTMFDGFEAAVSLPGVYHVMTSHADDVINTQATYLPQGDNGRRLTEIGLQQGDVTIVVSHDETTGALEVAVTEAGVESPVYYPQIVGAGNFSVEFVSENSVVIRDADGMTTRVVNNDALSVNIRAPAGYPHEISGMLGNNNGDMYDEDVNFGDGSGRDVGTEYLIDNLLTDEYVAENLVREFRLTSDDTVFVDDSPIDSTGGYAGELPPGTGVDYPDVDIPVDAVTVGVSVQPGDGDDGDQSNTVTRIELTDDETDETIVIETRINDGEIDIVTSPGEDGEDETVTSTGIIVPPGDWSRVYVTLAGDCNVTVVAVDADGSSMSYDGIPPVCHSNASSGYTVRNVSLGSEDNNIGLTIDDVTIVDEARSEEELVQLANTTQVDEDTRFQVDFNDPEHPSDGTIYEDWEDPNDNGAGTDVTGEPEGDNVIEPVIGDYPYPPEPPTVDPPALVTGDALAFCEEGLSGGAALSELSTWLTRCINEYDQGGENAAQAVIDAAIGSNPEVDPETPPTVDVGGTGDLPAIESCFVRLSAGVRVAEWTSRYVYDFNGVQTFLHFVGLYSGATFYSDVLVQGLFRAQTTFTSSFSELAIKHGSDVVAVLLGDDGVRVFVNDAQTSYPYGAATTDNVIVVNWMDDLTSSLFEVRAVNVIVRGEVSFVVRQQTSGSLSVKVEVPTGFSGEPPICYNFYIYNALDEFLQCRAVQASGW